MSDNKKLRDDRDRSKVDSKDKSEVEYLHSQYPQHSHEEIVKAIKKAGPVRKDIQTYLNKKSSSKNK